MRDRPREQLESPRQIATNKFGPAGGVLALLLAATLLTACASGSSGTLGAALGAGASDSPAGSADGSSDGASVGASVGSSGAGAPASSAAPKGNSNSKFCTLAAAEQAQDDKDSDAFSSRSPQDIQKVEEQALAALPTFLAAAPAQIKAAVQTLVTADQKFFAALKAAGFDTSKLDPSAVTALEDPQFTAASDAVTDYLEKVCGIEPDDDTTS
jgi:hypothetical protein